MEEDLRESLIEEQNFEYYKKLALEDINSCIRTRVVFDVYLAIAKTLSTFWTFLAAFSFQRCCESAAVIPDLMLQGIGQKLHLKLAEQRRQEWLEKAKG